MQNSLPICETKEEAGLLQQAFEIRDTLLKKKIVRFRGRGMCMFPVIWPKDIVYILSKKAREIDIGEVAVYRRNNHLVAHRTIAKGENQRGAYIITRPDSAPDGNDGRIYDENIVGVVTEVKRFGRIFSLATSLRRNGRFRHFFLGIVYKCYGLILPVIKNMYLFLIFIQECWPYRFLRRGWGGAIEEKIKIEFGIPLKPDMDSRFYREVSQEEFINLIENSEEKEVCGKWRASGYLNSSLGPSFVFVLRPQDFSYPGWWVSEVEIPMSYRGSRIPERIFCQAELVLKRMMVEKLFICLSKSEKANLLFFRRLGFCALDDFFTYTSDTENHNHIGHIVLVKYLES